MTSTSQSYRDSPENVWRQQSTVANHLQFSSMTNHQFNSKKDILIVGGGTSGLLLALECHRRGWAPTVLERRDSCQVGGKSLPSLCPYSSVDENFVDENFVDKNFVDKSFADFAFFRRRFYCHR